MELVNKRVNQMKIDWKHLATTPGYISLKACVRSDLEKRHRNKEELMKLFKRVIGLAQNHSHHTGHSIESILNAWEEKRNYWWLNYYSEFSFHKLRGKDSLKPQTIKSLKKEWYIKNYRDPIKRKHAVCREIQRLDKEKSTKTKKRWTKKDRLYRARRA